MNMKWLGLVLLAVSGFVFAQAGELYNADVIENTSMLPR